MSLEQLLYSFLPSNEYNDDLDTLLMWLHPNGHQNRPPSLRVKQCIRNISEIQSLEFPKLLNEYYMNITRSEYLKMIEMIGAESQLKFNSILSIEKSLSYPCTYIMLFQHEFVQVLNALRHYLVDNYPTFRKLLISDIRQLSLNDDLDLLQSYIDWIDASHAICISSKDVILDVIVEKIYIMCERYMKGKWTNRYLVMETFNKFIETYWSHFTKLLGCSENDHNLTTTVFNCFENTFIEIRTGEIYDIFLKSYPTSKPTILELKKTLRNNNNKIKNYNKIIRNYLKHFNKNILNPSVTTVDALLAYIRSIECFSILDPSGRYLKPLKNFIRPQLQQRKDLINILLYAILNLEESEFKELRITYVKDIDKLTNELSNNNDRNNDNFDRTDQIYNEQKRNSTDYIQRTGISLRDAQDFDDDMKNNSNNSTDKTYNGKLIYENVLKQFLIWVPEPNNIDGSSTNDINNDNNDMDDNTDGNVSMLSANDDSQIMTPSSRDTSNLLDVLLELCESKELFISEFLNVVTQKLLNLKSYHLDSKWMKCLQMIRDKYSVNSSNLISEEENGIFSGNSGINGNNNENSANGRNTNADMDDFTSSLNKIGVMLYDMKMSQRVYNKIQHTDTISHNENYMIFPKFITPLYWEPENVAIEDQIDNRSTSAKYPYNPEVQDEILKYAYEFSRLEPDKALHLCRDKGIITIEIDLVGKGKVSLTVTMPQYSVINKFDGDSGVVGLTLEQLLEDTRISKDELLTILHFWVEKHVLLYDIHTEKYVTNEAREIN
ncbi:similar to Saccharomyces cerevisiae YLR127C APC2 Subunit of the Anaphase-Promoting Complex/Cyclosome (APC/C) [Maudiozyma saulgeensis]|uniref:Similar to Saccharomyces cerevisiae YLR127C APC2 Subunit of the Anaphase-Promoting Complex/Cyclosome (APC/C) n=1 Tax=Maudiozyma saulgeensis TaxID=1789683 RepID=A0A1X7R5I7_9SACH|nr:similar to Saccharomyces cerevisiae YLR127C APC2 Subunit of the Anaphase-Promoting Complex/Cyclosome (APC/C) [Kazachstania saulgeensis]